MSQQIKIIYLLFISYFCVQLYPMSSTRKLKTLLVNSLSSTTEDPVMPQLNNLNLHILDARYLDSKEEDKAYLVIVNSQKFKSALVANKFIDILIYGPDCL